MIYLNMNNILSFDITLDGCEIALDLVKKLDLRKKDRINSFFRLQN